MYILVRYVINWDIFVILSFNIVLIVRFVKWFLCCISILELSVVLAMFIKFFLNFCLLLLWLIVVVFKVCWVICIDFRYFDIIIWGCILYDISFLVFWSEEVGEYVGDGEIIWDK